MSRIGTILTLVLAAAFLVTAGGVVAEKDKDVKKYTLSSLTDSVQR